MAGKPAAPDLAPSRSGPPARAAWPCSFWGRPGTLDSLAPSINYSSCHDVAKLYSVRLHSGDMAQIRDTAPVICRDFVTFAVRHAKKPQRRAPRPLAHRSSRPAPRSLRPRGPVTAGHVDQGDALRYWTKSAPVLDFHDG